MKQRGIAEKKEETKTKQKSKKIKSSNIPT